MQLLLFLFVCALIHHENGGALRRFLSERGGFQQDALHGEFSILAAAFAFKRAAKDALNDLAVKRKDAQFFAQVDIALETGGLFLRFSFDDAAFFLAAFFTYVNIGAVIVPTFADDLGAQRFGLPIAACELTLPVALNLLWVLGEYRRRRQCERRHD